MAQKNKKLSPFAYQISLQLKDMKSQKILVAFSGGRDSAVLLNLLLEMRERMKFEIALAHIHHGDASTKQKKYRALALEFAKQTAEKFELPFYTLKVDGTQLRDHELTKNSESEASQRRNRARLLEKLRAENEFDWIAFGHHAQDLFETRLIRLIRGTGMDGIEAMSLKRGKKLRPLLAHWPEDFVSYIEKTKLLFLNDPSNKDENFLRNWLRHRWVDDLEKKRPGSMRAFARSLEVMAQVGLSLHEQSGTKAAKIESSAAGSKILDRSEFRELDDAFKTQVLAQLLKNIGSRHYSLNMIKEILKRLDTPQKHLKFKVAGCEWQTNAKQILVRLARLAE